MERKDIKKAQGGFTLIEIIAVLVILGILAAVAIPRFFGLQRQAADRVAEAALAAGYSSLSLGWAANQLRVANAPAGPVAACNTIMLDGDTVTSVVCTGTTWPAPGANSVVTVTYVGGTNTTMTGTWTAP